MMNFNPTSLMVGKQLPDHIADDYPKFVEFLQAYYEFLEDYNVDIEAVKNLDTTADALLEFFRKELADKFPVAAIDQRKFLRSVRELYSRKGTLDAVELLFRIFFNETITISEPSAQILRASDGRWKQENFFTLETVHGSPLDPELQKEGLTINVSNQYGLFEVPVERVVPVTSTSIRVYYRSSNFLKLNLDEEVIIKKSEIGLFTGIVSRSVNSLKILQKGKNWIVGQAFVVPRTNGLDGRDTIARVTKVDSVGGILSVEIYDHGFEHATDQSIQISPFPNKPESGSFSLARTLVGVNPDKFDYTLTMYDYVEEIRERVVGISDLKDINSYFLENYVEYGYEGKQVLSVSYVQSKPTTSAIVDPSLSLSEWLESQALLVFDTAPIVKGRGYYTSDAGLISNSQIRLQDNFFYQLFSYAIETTHSIEEYKPILDLVHPAGVKYFGNLNKTADIIYDDELSVYRTLSNDTIRKLDIVETDDSFDKSLTMVKSDVAITSDLIAEKRANKYPITDTAVTNDGSGEIVATESKYANDYFAENYGIVDRFLNIG
jgi:hypothetical protein